ncbi:hypothetical protein [Methylophilus sp.]|uniref:hypothetical protein n=1 Tax=Methylophilus sp. TaxID=29541 RepID=UPI000D4B9839|nr:hypothetical protein [Methylophilus sp.]PPD11559.1 MAG: hypothetical protein CTY26_08535 [Methylophilus sp.]
MSQNQIKEISVLFEADTLTSVSPSTVYKLVDFMELESLDILINLMLRNLAAESGLLPTSSRVAYPSKSIAEAVKLNSLISKVTDENKHDLIFSDAYESHHTLDTKTEDEIFTVQISLESSEQVMKRWAKEMKALDDGALPEASKRLSFETWEDFYDIFSDKGKAMIEELRKN